jgi:hypothetical protein
MADCIRPGRGGLNVSVECWRQPNGTARMTALAPRDVDGVAIVM